MIDAWSHRNSVSQQVLHFSGNHAGGTLLHNSAAEAEVKSPTLCSCDRCQVTPAANYPPESGVLFPCWLHGEWGLLFYPAKPLAVPEGAREACFQALSLCIN